MKNNANRITWFCWKPNRDLLALAVSWILVVASLYAATFLVTAERGGSYFLLYGVLGATIFGIGIPLSWMVFVRKRTAASLGITCKNVTLSLGIQAVLFTVLFLSAYKSIHAPAVEKLLPILALATAIGFFEAVFWRGWMLSRLEESFGFVPALLLGSFLYAAYHIGYGMPVSEMTFLFFIGLMFAIVFRFTKNVFILWPLFQPFGQLITLLKDQLSLPVIAAVGFAEVLVAMFALIWFVQFIARKKGIVMTT